VNFTRSEQAILCTALNKLQNAMRATSETLQFFTLRQKQLACLGHEPARHLLERFTDGSH
jgi:hypothetical protein